MLGAVLGARTRTSRRVEAGAAGAAMIAAVSTGHYASMDECAAEWVDPMLGEAEDPDTALAQRYGKVFDAYVEARTALRPVWRSLAGARKSI
jgi:erythritol kinase